MTVEAATYIADLQPVNPPGTDPQSQGDDHLRLIKQVLQNTFGGASRQWQLPSAIAISTSTSITKANGESTIYVSTASGAVTATLPTLVAGDAGWKVRFVKTSSDANPIFIAPPTGTINSGGVAGVAKARRCIPGVPCEAIWDGAAWFVTRNLALPIGSCIEFHGSALPPGYEWPNGQTLSSAANYPEYNLTQGGLATLDKRGRIGVALDNLGGVSAGRLSGGFITGTAVGNTGGSDGKTLTVSNLPPYTPGGTIANGAITTTLAATGNIVGGPGAYCPGGGVYGNPNSLSALGVTATSTQAASTFTGTAQGGTSTAFGLLQPSIMVSQILVVE